MVLSLPQASVLRRYLWSLALSLLKAPSLCSAQQGGAASPVAGVLLPGLLGRANKGPQPWEDAGVLQCVERGAAEEEVMANLTRVVSMVREPPGDPLLTLRSALRRLGATLAHLSAVLASCLSPGLAPESAFSDAVARLGGFLEEGKLNDGLCPFTGQRQTTIGGSDVRQELGAFVKHGWDRGDAAGMARASKALRRLLRKVRKADGKDPPGSPPVNWELRAAMFGRGSQEL